MERAWSSSAVDMSRKMCYERSMTDIQRMMEHAKLQHLEAQTRYLEAVEIQIKSWKVLRWFLGLCGTLFVVGQLVNLFL